MGAQVPNRNIPAAIFVTALVLASAAALSLFAGCGQGPAPTTVVNSTPTSGPATTAPGSSDVTTPPAGAGAVEAVFAGLAGAVAPMTVYEPSFLPEDAALASQWLPVVDSADPASYSGPPSPNPLVLGSGPESEIQVVFQSGDGWLVILENFRGDLGDVAGTPVTAVAGRPANLYEVNGGELVQWSDQGLWYGVFGRDVSRDELIAVASGMRPVAASSS